MTKKKIFVEVEKKKRAKFCNERIRGREFTTFLELGLKKKKRKP